MEIVKYVLRFEYGEQTAKLDNKTLEQVFHEFCSLECDYVLCRKYHHNTFYAISHIWFDGTQWKIEDDHFYTSIHKLTHISIVNYELVIVKKKDYNKPSKNFGCI